MVETKQTIAHTELKEKAKVFLRKEGFRNITEEYFTGVFYTGYAICYREAVVDVVGFKGDRMALVECGSVTHGKLRTLSRHFKEVYHLPYGGEVKRVEKLPKEYWWEIK